MPKKSRGRTPSLLPILAALDADLSAPIVHHGAKHEAGQLPGQNAAKPTVAPEAHKAKAAAPKPTAARLAFRGASRGS